MKTNKPNINKFLMSPQPQTYPSNSHPLGGIVLKLLGVVRVASMKNRFRPSQMVPPKVIHQVQMKVKKLLARTMY